MTLFGEVTRHYVDIRNLEKVDASNVASPFLFEINVFDSELVFRDQETKELFVFDKNGFWNQEALEHPLLYWVRFEYDISVSISYLNFTSIIQGY